MKKKQSWDQKNMEVENMATNPITIDEVDMKYIVKMEPELEGRERFECSSIEDLAADPLALDFKEEKSFGYSSIEDMATDPLALNIKKEESFDYSSIEDMATDPLALEFKQEKSFDYSSIEHKSTDLLALDVKKEESFDFSIIEHKPTDPLVFKEDAQALDFKEEESFDYSNIEDMATDPLAPDVKPAVKEESVLEVTEPCFGPSLIKPTRNITWSRHFTALHRLKYATGKIWRKIQANFINNISMLSLQKRIPYKG